MHTSLLVLPKCQAPTLVMIFEHCGRPILQDICAKRCKPCRSGLWKCFLSKFEGVKMLPSCFFYPATRWTIFLLRFGGVHTDHTESLWPGNLGSRKIGCLSTQSRRSHVILVDFFRWKSQHLVNHDEQRMVSKQYWCSAIYRHGCWLQPFDLVCITVDWKAESSFVSTQRRPARGGKVAGACHGACFSVHNASDTSRYEVGEQHYFCICCVFWQRICLCNAI